MTILLFGRLVDILGRKIELRMPQFSTVADVRRAIAELYPASAGEISASRARALVDDTIAGEDGVVADGDEIAFLPPLSGG